MFNEEGNALLRCTGKLWGSNVLFILDSGAALEGALSIRMLPRDLKLNHQGWKRVMVGDGRIIQTQGSIQSVVTFQELRIPINFVIFKARAFDALLGMQFLRRPEVKELNFHPPQLKFRQELVLPLSSEGV